MINAQKGFRCKLSDQVIVENEITIEMEVTGPSVYDFSCFGVDSQNKLSDDRYMVFYNQLFSPNREIVQEQRNSGVAYRIKLASLPATINKLVFTVAIDGNSTMSAVGRCLFALSQNNDRKLLFELSGSDFQNEKALIVFEIYKKDVWRIAAIGNGFNGGLSALLKAYGGNEASLDSPTSPVFSASPVSSASPVGTPAGGNTSYGQKSSCAGERSVGVINGVEYAFITCPPGTFMMGSPENEPDHQSYEQQHVVTLSQPFLLLETPVTQIMWQSLMGNNPSYFKGDNLPVEQVSWNDCQMFIDKLNRLDNSQIQFRLPTEAEWEYACRAGTSTMYSFGNWLNGIQANCNGNKPCGTSTQGPLLGQTTPVKTYPPNAWGLYDMHGNVCEWCEDWFNGYPRYKVTNPIEQVQSELGPIRVLRGGSWNVSASFCRSAWRCGYEMAQRRPVIGFRLAVGPKR